MGPQMAWPADKTNIENWLPILSGLQQPPNRRFRASNPPPARQPSLGIGRAVHHYIVAPEPIPSTHQAWFWGPKWPGPLIDKTNIEKWLPILSGLQLPPDRRFRASNPPPARQPLLAIGRAVHHYIVAPEPIPSTHQAQFWGPKWPGPLIKQTLRTGCPSCPGFNCPRTDDSAPQTLHQRGSPC